MGHVWLARDERSGLDVALKIVPREGKAAHRAEREARAAASLRHNRCQRIIALAHDNSHVYIAYEYIPGRTLREALRSGGGLPLGARCRLALARDDLQRNLDPRGLVAREPDGPRAAASERLQRAVSTEHELVRRDGYGRFGHRAPFGAARRMPFRPTDRLQ